MYEADTAAGARERGGVVDLCADLGGRALRAAGLAAGPDAGARTITP
ncbi:hypothetical protein ACIF9R_35680 [Streptomyces sp. NPDC086080]